MEGKILHHCVSSYAGSCANGDLSIFSMKKNNNSQLTIEVDLETKNIDQVRGNCNRLANADEMEIVRKWEKIVLNQ